MSLRAQCGPYTVVVRQASHGDVDGIRNLVHSIYRNDGDYVYDQYHELLHTLPPQLYSVVAEIDGKVVGFCFMTLLEDDETVYEGGARVHPDYERIGINRLMAKVMTDKYLKRVKPKRIVRTTSWVSSNRDSLADDLEMTPFQIVHAVIDVDDFRRSVRRVLQERSFTPADCSDIIALPPNSWHHVVSAEDLCKLFPTPYHLMQMRCFVLHSVTPSNLPRLISANDQVLISVQHTSQNTSTSYSRSLSPTAISFSEIFISTDGERAWLFFTLYGTANAGEFQRHLTQAVVRLMRRLSTSFRGRIRFTVICPSAVNRNDIEGFFRDIDCTVTSKSNEVLMIWVRGAKFLTNSKM